VWVECRNPHLFLDRAAAAQAAPAVTTP
jgi:hypothetical protein